ncbi:FAD-dependent monooxygenase [Mycobacterium sp. 852002-10029_SCH5224772]|uniref:FAD-dependent monooxygenase n=1 Tax=Mycobacterium sp. 852002-10029_SCH5224772 TaxID=1834083 RepID=UPI0008002788|nr:FAD-dependent monooxygenase [Mycobacterium sp. 852002-10029_SCH5224772]OBE98150.1 oxygenase [Mycobacterium sp. 852002-10029_SCH5224772]
MPARTLASVDTVDVVVVGAGPTGLTLACGLLLHGVSVRVVDRAAGPAVTSRANFLHARGSEVLDRVGALGTLPDQSLRAMRVTTYLGDQPIMNLQFGDPGLRTAAPPMLVSQAKVEGALRNRLAELGGAVEWGRPLSAVASDGDGVTAELGGGRAVRAQWIVGCDGTGSTTRALAGIGFPGVRLSERFLLADVHLDWDVDRGGTTGWLHRKGLIGVMPMPDPQGQNDLWRVIAYDPGDDEKPSEHTILERLQQILPERTQRRVRLGEAVWLSQFSVHRRLADTYRRGRILLAGDAAHAHAPFGGQGMLTGVGDAENLAWKLALVVAGRAADRLIDSYEAERRPLATEVLRGTSTITRINVANNPVGRFARDRIVARLVGLAAVQRWATYSASQLWGSYRKGPLGGRGRKPRPGDRISDLPCVREDGAMSRLHAELGGRWALLVPHDPDMADVEGAQNRLGGNLGVLSYKGKDAMLVRPDAHLGWRGDAEDTVGLDRWLTNAFDTGRTR